MSMQHVGDGEVELPGYAALLCAYRHSGEAVFITDNQNRIISVNPAFTYLTGYTQEEVLGRDPKLLSSGRFTPEEYAALWRSVNETDFWEGEIWDRRKDGTIYPKWLVISVVRDTNGALVNYVASFNDISDRREAADRLAHLAYHDPLTHLPNRLAYESQLDLALKTCLRDGTQIAIMLIDLDRFKTVNDTLGHHVGDGLLKSVALRLRESVRARGAE